MFEGWLVRCMCDHGQIMLPVRHDPEDELTESEQLCDALFDGTVSEHLWLKGLTIIGIVVYYDNGQPDHEEALHREAAMQALVRYREIAQELQDRLSGKAVIE